MSYSSELSLGSKVVDIFSLRPSKSITRLAWRPLVTGSESNVKTEMQQQSEDMYLAVSSEDSSLRLYSVSSSLQK